MVIVTEIIKQERWRIDSQVFGQVHEQIYWEVYNEIGREVYWRVYWQAVKRIDDNMIKQFIEQITLGV